jgi:hypothetical protein
VKKAPDWPASPPPVPVEVPKPVPALSPEPPKAQPSPASAPEASNKHIGIIAARVLLAGAVAAWWHDTGAGSRFFGRSEGKSMKTCIAAITTLAPIYPGYVNFSREDDGSPEGGSLRRVGRWIGAFLVLHPHWID